ncbi:terminase family protein [Jeongeupia wiesaeckerbachi]|uniref:terminase large subunit domain-containing protein n=1 Tax=Jeongeupia wiesaeckerbachi TaxID=3051218 RepID=UPI003D806885
MTVAESRLDRAPTVLLPYQQRWCADETPVKLMEKSRRIGLSWGEAADSALLAASQRGMDVWYIGYNKDMAQEFIRDCADWAKHYSLAAGEIEQTEEVFKDGDDEKAILSFVIRFASGFRITALSSRPSNLRGKQGRVIIDEAAFHENLAELLKAAMALLMWGGQVHIISTHDGVDNAFNELVTDSRSGKKPYSLHRVTFDDALADGLYRRICLRRGIEWTADGEAVWAKEIRDFYGDDAEEELDCVPKNSGGAWLSRALIESRMSADTPVLRWVCKEGFELLPDHIRTAECRDWLEAELAPLLAALPADAISFNGEDFGRSGDLSVHVPLIQTQNLVRRVPFIIELRNVPFRQQEQVAFYLLDRLPRFTGGAFDARGNGQFLAEVAMQRYGASRIQQVMLSESWYREHMAPVKAALEDGTLVDLPQDADVLADLRAVQIIKGVPRIPDSRTTGADKGKRHGDAAVAVALAYFASRELNKGPVSVKSRRRRKGARITQGYQ